MTRFLLWIVAMALGLVALAEVTWRRDHAPAKPDAWSSQASRAAEVRLMPEGTLAPYGLGVYIRPTWSPLNFVQAELAFAGYCSAMSTRWLADDLLQVNCEMSPGGKEPVVPASPVAGVRVKVVVIRPRGMA